jgi:hypothetical protein
MVLVKLEKLKKYPFLTVPNNAITPLSPTTPN